MFHHGGWATLPVCTPARLFHILLIVSAVLCPRLASAQALPAGWTATNIGSATPTGRAAYVAGTFAVEGGGTRIYSTSDQFFYVHQRMSGDGTVVARVASLENTNSWAKAGVMIRESLSADAKHAFGLVTPARGVAFHRRTSTGGTTSHTGTSGSAPVWLRMVRAGSRFTASRSSNGTSWTTIGSATISMASTVYVGLAVSSYDASTLATGVFTDVSVSGAGGGSLPPGWTAGDVGSPALAGSTSATGSSFTIRGAGADIWGTSDQFQYAYQQVSGDVDIVARVASLDGPHSWSKAGVMIRPSLSGNAANAMALVSRSRGIDLQSRPESGLSTTATTPVSGTAPVWLKLERRGSAISAFRSSDGTRWSMLGSATLALGSRFYVGLAVTSHDVTRLATAQFTDVAVTTPSSTPNTPPTVSLTSPAEGATFTAPATVDLAASATDADGGVAQVEFFANGTLLGVDTSSPYTHAWTGVPAGSYSLTAVARDQAGATTTSAARSITVSGGSTPNTPPTVSLTAPAAGATYAAPASVTISASAADADGTIARVEFFAGATLVGSDTSSPYSVLWNNAPAGSYSITAVAHDDKGATTTSAARSISITASAPPSRALFVPSPDHSTVTRYVLDIFTQGANPGSASPMATQDLGKPAVVNGECSVDIAATISGLPGGNYFATVVAVSPGGTSTRAVSASFTR